jgi:hypothetical protein
VAAEAHHEKLKRSRFILGRVPSKRPPPTNPTHFVFSPFQGRPVIRPPNGVSYTCASLVGRRGCWWGRLSDTWTDDCLPWPNHHWHMTLVAPTKTASVMVPVQHVRDCRATGSVSSGVAATSQGVAPCAQTYPQPAGCLPAPACRGVSEFCSNEPCTHLSLQPPSWWPSRVSRHTPTHVHTPQPTQPTQPTHPALVGHMSMTYMNAIENDCLVTGWHQPPACPCAVCVKNRNSFRTCVVAARMAGVFPPRVFRLIWAVHKTSNPTPKRLHEVCVFHECSAHVVLWLCAGWLACEPWVLVDSGSLEGELSSEGRATQKGLPAVFSFVFVPARQPRCAVVCCLRPPPETAATRSCYYSAWQWGRVHDWAPKGAAALTAIGVAFRHLGVFVFLVVCLQPPPAHRRDPCLRPGLGCRWTHHLHRECAFRLFCDPALQPGGCDDCHRPQGEQGHVWLLSSSSFSYRLC